MAIPGTPQQFAVQTSNQQVLISWGLSSGATSYIVQRSLDNVTFTLLATISGSPLATSYLDTTAALGTQYWYQVAAVNASGTSPFSASDTAIPTPTGEMSLYDLRLKAKQRADRVNSQFVSDSEWRGYINAGMAELYDLLVTVYEDYFIAQPVKFTADGQHESYLLPNGSNSFQVPSTGATIIPEAFLKLTGVDLALNTYPNAYVTLEKFNFTSRNDYVFPNSSSSLYGVFNPKYRIVGNRIHFMPTPSAGQQIRLWYIPRAKELLMDTDTTVSSINGWVEYVIVRAAMYALTKEESDTTQLQAQLVYLKSRIEESAANRDAGSPDTISDSRQGPWGGSGNNGPGGFGGGY